MRITVLVPSREYVNNAGARIRYRRLSTASDVEMQVQLEDIAQFDPRSAQCDVLIISKCHDARSLMAATVCVRRGIRVGVDLFDDYFSQQADSRLNRFRLWLSQLLDICDFAMCSTELMAETVREYRPDIPTFVLNDPAPFVNYPQLAQQLARKLDDARDEGRLRLAWFGVGDNPNFAVGLSDLAALSDMLSRLSVDGMFVELSILTNARALDAARLAMIRQLPVHTTVAEWSEKAEAELLRSSLACFLPVNAQRFSAAKSLNRAVTALSSGCQVLSAGYPLYEALDEFIYRDHRELIEDVAAGHPRLNSGSVDKLRETLDLLASSERATRDLQAFLLGLAERNDGETSERPLFLVHGYATNGAAHKMVQAVGGLSVASPFCPAPLDFDIVFQMRPGQSVAMLVSDKGLSRMRPQSKSSAVVHGQVGKRNFWEIREPSKVASDLGAWSDPSLSLQLALYPSVMAALRASLDANFGSGRVIISENSTVPFEMVG